MNKKIKTNKDCFEQIKIQRVLKPKKKKRKIAKIVDFFVTTDSVVAKATLVTETPPRFVEVDWGDGKTDIIDHHFGTRIQDPSRDNPLPPGTYEFYHRYDVLYIDRYNSTGPAPQEHVVILMVNDNDGGIDFRTERIMVVPKYRTQYYRLHIGLKDRCDPFYERENEFSIIQTVDGEIKNEWDWNPSNNFFFYEPFYALEGSQLTSEFEIIDPTAMPLSIVKFLFTEDDTFIDDHVTIHINIPLFGNFGEEENYSSRKEGTVGPQGLLGCEIMYAVDYNVKLLVPLPRNPHVTVTRV